MEHREKEESSRVEGRNPVLEALRSGRSVDKVYIQAGLHDGPIQTILREARKRDAIVAFVTKERLNQMSETGNHQGVIAAVASYQYSTVEDILKRAEEKGEDPFLILLDEIEDPHNLGGYYPYRQSGRRPRSDHYPPSGGGAHRHCGQSFRRRRELYAGGQGDQSVRHY